MDRRSWTVAKDMQREIQDWAEHERFARAARDHARPRPSAKGRLWLIVVMLVMAGVILLTLLPYLIN